MSFVTHPDQWNGMGILLWKFQVYALRGFAASIVTSLETKHHHKKKPELTFLTTLGYKERESGESCQQPNESWEHLGWFHPLRLHITAHTQAISNDIHRKAAQLIPAKIPTQDNEEQITWLFQMTKVFAFVFIFQKKKKRPGLEGIYFVGSQQRFQKSINKSWMYNIRNRNVWTHRKLSFTKMS